MNGFSFSFCALFVVVTTAACSSPMSAEEHRARAAEEHAEAARHAEQYDPDADARRFVADPLEQAPLVVEHYNPTEDERTAAGRHQRRAERHQQAAAELEASEDARCHGVRPAARSACPLLSPVEVEDIPRGVRVTFASIDGATRAAAVIRCQQAFAATRAFEDLPSCALFARGLHVEQKGKAVELRAPDGDDVLRLRSNVRAHRPGKPMQ